MHETPKGADPHHEQELQQKSREDQQPASGGADSGATGMQDGEESGAGYGNNAGKQGG